jgi:glutaredoxin
MTMQLLVARWSSACDRAQETWREVATARGIALDIVDIETAAGLALAERLNLATVPVLLIDGRPAAVGVQSKEEAHRLIDAALGQET